MIGKEIKIKVIIKISEDLTNFLLRVKNDLKEKILVL